MKQSNKVEFTKELGGTLLIVMDGKTFELSRSYISSNINIICDDKSQETTEEQEKILLNEWINSEAKNR